MDEQNTIATIRRALHETAWTPAVAATYAAAYPDTLDDGPITAAERYEGLTLIARGSLCAATAPAVIVRLAGNLSVIAAAWKDAPAGGSPCSH